MVSSSLHPLGAPLWASRCVPNLKPAPRARAPASQKDRCVSVCCLCSSLRVAVCQELPFICYSPTGSRNTSVPGLQSQVLKGCPLMGCMHVLAVAGSRVLLCTGDRANPWKDSNAGLMAAGF